MLHDLSKLDEIVTEEYHKLCESHGLPVGEKKFSSRLKKIGAKRFRFELDDELDFLPHRIIELNQKNPDSILCYLGYDIKGHDVFAIPREMAEKIVILGGIP